MIKNFRHKGLQAFYESGSKAGIQPDHAAKIERQLVRLDAAQTPDCQTAFNIHIQLTLCKILMLLLSFQSVRTHPPRLFENRTPATASDPCRFFFLAD